MHSLLLLLLLIHQLGCMITGGCSYCVASFATWPGQLPYSWAVDGWIMLLAHVPRLSHTGISACCWFSLLACLGHDRFLAPTAHHAATCAFLRSPTWQVFETRRENTHAIPPSSDAPIVVRDRGSAGPRFMRSTLNMLPQVRCMLAGLRQCRQRAGQHAAAAGVCLQHASSLAPSAQPQCCCGGQPCVLMGSVAPSAHSVLSP